MSKSSNPFIDTITVRLLSRSASTPPGTLKRISGIKRMIWANAACPWAVAVLAGVDDRQQDDDLLPGVVVEGSKRLRNDQPD